MLLLIIGKTLYVMADEKWIHEQDKKNNEKKKKYIMSKCFVVFTHIKSKGKRNTLKGKHVFITTSSNPYKELMDEICKIYDFEKVETINLLSDAGSWILAGKSELKLYAKNNIVVNTCEFHVKQKINRSTTDKDLRRKLYNIIYDEEKWRNEFNDFYYLQTPKELLKSKCGICWDQVELERELFKNTKFKYETYFIYLNDNNMLPSHTFLVYQNNNNYYWFEHSWNKYMGVHQYKSMKKLYEDVKNKFVKENNYVSKNATFGMYLYEKPKEHIKCMEFYDYVVTGKKINI